MIKKKKAGPNLINIINYKAQYAVIQLVEPNMLQA